MANRFGVETQLGGKGMGGTNDNAWHIAIDLLSRIPTMSGLADMLGFCENHNSYTSCYYNSKHPCVAIPNRYATTGCLDTLRTVAN